MTAQQLKNSILQMAVQGKLVPQDPNDEPASVLLERIRAEKEQLIKQKKIKKEKNPSYIFRGADNTPYEKIGNADGFIIADFLIRSIIRRKTALRELALSAVNHCTAINKETILLSLILFLLLDYGYVGKTVLIMSTPTQVVVAAVDGASTTLALHIIVAMF